MSPTGTPAGTVARVALVTGAARGIGAATVRALVADGWRVVAVDGCQGRDHGLPGVRYPLADRADLDRLADLGDAVATYVADVRDPDALRAAAATATERWGRLDAAVAAAAVMAGGRPLWETDPREVATLWEVDVLGVWNTAAAVVPPMLAGPDPAACRFVAVASAAGGRGLFHLGGYTVAKHAVVGLVRALAADLVGTGVTAVAVSPGATRTAMLDATADLYGLADPAELAGSQLTGRVHEPDEVAATVVHCCSVAGGLLNGSVVSVEGGTA